MTNHRMTVSEATDNVMVLAVWSLRFSGQDSHQKTAGHRLSTATHYRLPDMNFCKKIHGFTLLEVLIGVFLSTLLMTGIVQLLSAGVAAYRLQLEMAQLEESGRYARSVLQQYINQSGYHPEPWLLTEEFTAVSDEAQNSVSAKGDQIGLQQLSRLNCYGNDNPVTDDAGQPEYYLLQTRFRVNAANNLAITCRYGPDASSLVTQMNNFGLVEGVENMQVLYAEDQDGDTFADHWITARTWQNEKSLRALKIALLFSTRQAFGETASMNVTLLDKSLRPPPDGHLRHVITLTSAIHGRSTVAAVQL